VCRDRGPVVVAGSGDGVCEVKDVGGGEESIDGAADVEDQERWGEEGVWGVWVGRGAGEEAGGLVGLWFSQGFGGDAGRGTGTRGEKAVYQRFKLAQSFINVHNVCASARACASLTATVNPPHGNVVSGTTIPGKPLNSLIFEKASLVFGYNSFEGNVAGSQGAFFSLKHLARSQQF
jgi:hypothetical protein